MAELVAMMIGVPLLLLFVLPAKAILPVLWLMALICYLLIRKSDPRAMTGHWKQAAINRANLVPMLVRFLICAVLLGVITWQFQPKLLFNFVQQKPWLWALVMVLYPILSVLPQEIIYRRYVFARFPRAMGWSPMVMVLISGVGFGFGHIVFGNWVAPVLCVFGGLIFAQTYHKTRSLAFVCLEHALYGNFIFTLGLGRYFYHGALS